MCAFETTVNNDGVPNDTSRECYLDASQLVNSIKVDNLFHGDQKSDNLVAT